MRSRELPSSDGWTRNRIIYAAVGISLLLFLTAAFLYLRGAGQLILENPRTGETYSTFPLRRGEEFSIGFIHSVNKSPVTDFYEIRKDGIYVIKTVYYGFGAGVQTELEEGQHLSYGEDGSMIVTGFDTRMDNLVYFVGTVSDHTLTLPGREISLRDLCGRSSMVRFSYQSLWDKLFSRYCSLKK